MPTGILQHNVLRYVMLRMRISPTGNTFMQWRTSAKHAIKHITANYFATFLQVVFIECFRLHLYNLKAPSACRFSRCRLVIMYMPKCSLGPL